MLVFEGTNWDMQHAKLAKRKKDGDLSICLDFYLFIY